VLLLSTHEILTYYEAVCLVRCFLYEDRIRVGCALFGPNMPPLISLRDKQGDRVALLKIPEQFQGLDGPVMIGDGHPAKFNASPRMVTFEILPKDTASLQRSPTLVISQPQSNGLALPWSEG
jgi:hypothetical protein